MKPKFVLSSSTFNTIKEAEEQVREWQEEGTLDSECKLYKVTECYKPIIRLEKIK